MAVDQTNVLRVPCKVLSVQDRIVNGDVLTLPERVLGNYFRIADNHILAVLEHIFCIAHKTIDLYVFRKHERIGAATELDILNLEAVDLPEGLVSIGNKHAFQLDILHLTEELGAIDLTVTHNKVVGVPDGRTRTGSKIAIGNKAAVHMPPGVLSVELAPVGLNIAAMLDA